MMSVTTIGSEVGVTLSALAAAPASQKVSVATDLINSVRQTSHAALGFCRSPARPCEPLKFVAILNAPFCIYDMAQAAKSIPGSSNNEKVDAALNLTSGVGTLGLISTSIAEALASVGAVAARGLAWVTPLAIVCGALGIADLVRTGRQWIEGRRFSKDFKRAISIKKPTEDYTLTDFQRGVGLLESKHVKEKSFIEKHCDIKGSVLLERLKRIEQLAIPIFASGNQQEINKCKQTLKSTMELLGKRVTKSKWSKPLKLLTDTVGLVGLGLLISPLTVVGLAVLAPLSAYSTGSAIAKIREMKQFELKLDILVKTL